VEKRPQPRAQRDRLGVWVAKLQQQREHDRLELILHRVQAHANSENVGA